MCSERGNSDKDLDLLWGTTGRDLLVRFVLEDLGGAGASSYRLKKANCERHLPTLPCDFMMGA